MSEQITVKFETSDGKEYEFAMKNWREFTAEDVALQVENALNKPCKNGVKSDEHIPKN